jgi:hypothetical protein
VEVGGFLAAAAGLLVLWFLFGVADARDEPVEGLEGDFG